MLEKEGKEIPYKTIHLGQLKDPSSMRSICVKNTGEVLHTNSEIVQGNFSDYENKSTSASKPLQVESYMEFYRGFGFLEEKLIGLVLGDSYRNRLAPTSLGIYFACRSKVPLPCRAQIALFAHGENPQTTRMDRKKRKRTKKSASTEI